MLKTFYVKKIINISIKIYYINLFFDLNKKNKKCNKIT